MERAQRAILWSNSALSHYRCRICMVLEYAKLGNLRDFLVTDPFLDWKNDKRTFSIDIARGMHYLHSQDNPIYHRDLKTINCLVTDTRVVKISDFGEARVDFGYKERKAAARERKRKRKNMNDTNLSRAVLDVFSDDEDGVGGSGGGFESPVGEDDEVKLDHTGIHSDLPPEMVGSLLFMSPEVLRSEKFTKACDVYSYGCILADIATEGNLNALYLSSSEFRPQKILSRIAKGWRPELPKNWERDSPVLYNLIYACWNQDVTKRPSFKLILEELNSWDGEILLNKNIDSVMRRGEMLYTTEESVILVEAIKEIYTHPGNKRSESDVAVSSKRVSATQLRSNQSSWCSRVQYDWGQGRDWPLAQLEWLGRRQSELKFR